MIKKVSIPLIFFTILSAEPYSFGNGYQLHEDLPIYIGGYFSVEQEVQNKTNIFSVDDIAFLSYGSFDGYSYMAEFEYTKLYTKRWGSINAETTNTTLYKERLYLQYEFDSAHSLRVGKFNNEVGLWNMTPINVLRETSSNPEFSNIIYPKFMTGLKYTYLDYSDIGVKYDVMFQLNENLDGEYNNYQIDQYGGIGLSVESENSIIKANIGYFKELNGRHYLYYALAGYKYTDNDWEMMGEIGSQYSDNQFTTKYALYLQGLYRIDEHHALILRGESYENLNYTSTQNLLITGYTYRPITPLALKAEYQFNQIKEYNKFICSFSVLF